MVFAALVDGLRRIPGYRQVEERTALLVVGLLAVALVLLSIWMAQRSPQRVSMSELVGGDVSQMQSWIIISGEVRPEQASGGGFRYVLTDPAVPNAQLVVSSDVPLTEGHTTVSGIIAGGSRGAQGDFIWLGQMRADTVLALEPDPPWGAIAFAGVAIAFGLGSRTTYPMFFREPARSIPVETREMRVGVRREWPPFSTEPVTGTVTTGRNVPVSLSLAGETKQMLRMHSAKSSAEVGRLERLGERIPALLLRPTVTEMALTFDSREARDACLAALVADAQRQT